MVVDVLYDVMNSSLKDCESLRFCLVDDSKKPYKVDNTLARPNHEEDFIPLFALVDKLNTTNYKGLGISIQASKICAVDVDHCFSKAFDVNTIDERGKRIIDIFKGHAYIEFSFSGTGLRVLFTHAIIPNYSKKYFIKNSKCNTEYYQPSSSYRYVTVTGKYLYNNTITDVPDQIIFTFLNEFMLKPEKNKKEVNTTKEIKSFDELMKLVRKHYIKNNNFQDLWFSKAPGSGSDESERDYHILSYIYENITQDKALIKQIFEASPFFKSKDSKHVNKWNYQNFRYFEYVFDNIKGEHEQ